MPVSDLASEILDPILRKRAGISIGLVQSWEEIAGPRLATHTRPEKIVWPRRMQEDDPFQPATLIMACEGFAAGRGVSIASMRETTRSTLPSTTAACRSKAIAAIAAAV